MAIALASPQVKSPLLRRSACFCGRDLTFYIYVLHVPLYGIIQEWQGQVAAFAWLAERRWVTTPLIAVLSTLLAVVFYRLSQWRRG